MSVILSHTAMEWGMDSCWKDHFLSLGMVNFSSVTWPKTTAWKLPIDVSLNTYSHMYSNDILAQLSYWQDLFFIHLWESMVIFIITIIITIFLAVKYIGPWDNPFPPEAGCIRLWMVWVCVCRSGGLSGLLCGVARVVHVFSYIVMRDPCTQPA